MVAGTHERMDNIGEKTTWKGFVPAQTPKGQVEYWRAQYKPISQGRNMRMKAGLRETPRNRAT